MQKNKKQQPINKVSQPSEDLTDSELQSMMQDFHQSIQDWEKEEGVKLIHNFGEELSTE